MVRAIAFDLYGVLIIPSGLNTALFDYIKNDLKPYYRVALISNAGKESTERRVPREYLDIFDELVLSGEVGHSKPDREIFEIAADRLGVSLSEMVFIDDMPHYVRASADYGIKSILYEGFDSLKVRLREILGAN